jgi:Pyruvate/2-oxoacid:ferredoxin oxidoreductase delta subunit
MKELLIFYFSGTGNARQVAEWMKEDVMEKGVKCSLYDITRVNINEITIDNDAHIGLISPVHGFNYPPIMLNFISRFKYGHNKVILMNTRAGMKIGSVVTPGITGIAFLLSAMILSIKGYKVIGMVPFDMPSNWLSLHPALRGKAVDYIFEKNHQRVNKHSLRLINNEHDFTALREIVQDLLISPIALLYYAIGRFFIAKTFYASHTCLHCDMCIMRCPKHAIIKKSGHPYWTFKCESCMKCMNICPGRAIETSHGLVMITVLCTLLLSSSALYAMLPSIFDNALVSFITINVFLFILMGLLYRIQHVLIMYKFTGKLIHIFSLTHFKWWGRYRRNGRL